MCLWLTPNRFGFVLALFYPHHLASLGFTGHCPFAPRPTAPRPTGGVRSCADPPPLASAWHRPPNWERRNGARSRGAASLFYYVTEPGDSCGKINPFPPARRRRTVDHSLLAGTAQLRLLQACLPDGHTVQCLFSACSPWFPGIRAG